MKRRLGSTQARARRVVNAALEEHETQHDEELLTLCLEPKCVMLVEIERLLAKVRA